MKTVTLTADLRPYRAGDDIHVDDTTAQMLVDNKEAKDMRPFGGAAQGYQTRAESAEPRRGGYKTKEARP